MEDQVINIGVAIEDVGGVIPEKSELIRLTSVRKEPIVGKSEKVLIVDARFDCPCCGNGVYIKIHDEVD